MLSRFLLTKAIKRAAVEAVRAEKPAAVCFGKVTSVSPLKIMVEQKMALGMPQLVLTRNVTDHNVNISGSDTQQVPQFNPVIPGIHNILIALRR